jgi:tRNA modification GTPase
MMTVYEARCAMSFEKTMIPHPEDTIVAVSSASGSAARAIVRISGPNTHPVVSGLFETTEGLSLKNLPAGRVVKGSCRLTGIHSLLPAWLYLFRGPRSYTGQDLAEIHTIGSPPLVERLITDILACGARAAQPGEFTLRAFLAGKMDLPQAEAVHAVIEAGTDAELQTALDQLAGGVSQPLATLRDDLLNLLADMEAALDFADEDIQFVGRSETLDRLDAAIQQLRTLLQQLDNRALSTATIRVALVGLPNAGKSSLFNTIAGGDALVSPIAGTTRDYLTKRVDLNGVHVELCDTAGFQDATDSIQEQAQILGRNATSRADVILWCNEHGRFDEVVGIEPAASGAEVIRVRTKADLVGDGRQAIGDVCCSLPNGLAPLLTLLTQKVQSLSRPATMPSLSRCRHHVAECVENLAAAREHVATEEPPELAASALRAALDQLGEVTGAVYTNDLLDRIFSRFCIGK